MYRYVAVIERASSGNYAGYFPALPGTGATGATREEVVKALRGVLIMHLHGMLKDAEEIPDSDESAEIIEVSDEEVRAFEGDLSPSGRSAKRFEVIKPIRPESPEERRARRELAEKLGEAFRRAGTSAAEAVIEDRNSDWR